MKNLIDDINDLSDFAGTKAALINNGKLLTILRDDKPTIDNPNMWDFPGGEREPGETPFQVAQREIWEELGIKVSQVSAIWASTYPAVNYPERIAAFFVIEITEEQIKSVLFGDEGQEWKMVTYEEFLKNDNAIPGMKTRLKDFLAQNLL